MSEASEPRISKILHFTITRYKYCNSMIPASNTDRLGAYTVHSTKYIGGEYLNILKKIKTIKTTHFFLSIPYFQLQGYI